jgi:hypothetical protein
MQRHKRLVRATFLACLLLGPLEASELSVNQRALVGVPISSVVVEFFERAEDAAAIGLTRERLRTVAELELRRGAIEVSSAENQLGPYLYVNVQLILIPLTPPGAVYQLELEVHEPITVPPPRRLVVATVWSSGMMGASPQAKASADIEDAIRRLVEGFENDFLAANPRKAPR